ncbi:MULTISPECIES: response regulator [Hydrogenophaga]|uniref:Two component transcriptional regulator, LuxR family n=1 Tax=Hydrogenophaga intermedia TaxID=65786 RepID=A0A1L1PNF4_HYDIT|nr:MULTISPECIES: response regulator [Hydrogenophaga]AOS78228.1 DNA-binding response regulator [Hydrogenophaga sp. PBC]CDN87556.1 Two component transcriptional regulator, LuxR family [Hydrogenophaga intermedia]
MSDAPIRLLVVDDHHLFRRGLIALLAQDTGLAVVGEAGDATAAIGLAERLRPDLVLLDNHMPGVTGIDAIAAIKASAPAARVLMLTVSENEADLARGLRSGADGYLLKTIDTADLAASIRRVVEGDSVISPEMMGKLVALLRRDTVSEATGGVPAAKSHAASAAPQPAARAVPEPPPSDPIHSLSPREREILRLIAHGDSNKHIARALDIAETTVKIHVQHILRKLDLSTRVHAAVYASERGLLA